MDCNKIVIPLSGQRKQDISILGTVSITKMNLESRGLIQQILTFTGQSAGQEMEMEPTKFQVQNANVHYDNMQVNVGNNPVNFSGNIGFDKKLDMTVTLPWTFAGKTAHVGKETSAPRIPVPLGGTISEPAFKPEKLIPSTPDKIIEALPDILDMIKRR